MKVLFFAHVKDAVGRREVNVDADGLDAGSLWELLIHSYPVLAVHRSVVRLARNGEFARTNEIFNNSDEVALIPPVSGG
jgi:molybdopterin converting factor subunit 1